MEPSELSTPYADCLRENRWDDYTERLARDGINWCLEMNFPTLAAHLAPLQNSPRESDLPDRIAFLSAACGMEGALDPMENFFKKFLAQNDTDAAVAASAIAVFMILNESRDYDRFLAWDERLAGLISSGAGMSPLASASALGNRGFIQCIGGGNYIQAVRLLRKAIFQSDAAQSVSLKLWCSIHISHCYLCMGDLSMLDIILFDIEPFTVMAEIPFLLKADYACFSGWVQCIRGNARTGKRILLEIFENPHFQDLPGGYSLFFHGRLLEFAIFDNDEPMIKTCAKKIQATAIPEGNQYSHAYLHMNLSRVHLTLGNFEQALCHVQDAIEREKLVQTVPCRYALELLSAQIMSELKKDEKVVAFFESRIPEWTQNGFLQFISTAYFELSRIYLRQGKVDSAREQYEKGIQTLPRPATPVSFNRPNRFFMDLRQALFPDSTRTTEVCEFPGHRVRIETFGGLRLHMNGRTIYDRQWKGRRTRFLLKALIVFGPTKVPMDLLTDLLWPDADGDMGVNNLRVTLSRLRKIGQPENETAVNWIKVKQGKVSLVQPLCDVDAFRFRTCLTKSFQEPDIDLLMNTLDLYQDDFLKDDINESWIIRHRDLFRREFIKSALFLAEQCREEGEIIRSMPYISKAVDMDPCNEGLHAALMRAHLALGNGAEALRIYRRATKIFKDQFDMAPGADLTSLVRQARRLN